MTDIDVRTSSPLLLWHRPPGGWGLSLDWLPLVLLPGTALSVRCCLPAWLFMWLLALSIFFGCKWLTWRRACRSVSRPAIGRSLAYLLVWPGMDAVAFLGNHKQARRGNKPGTPGSWSFAIAKTLVGAWLIFFAAREASSLPPLLTGWAAMIGLVLFLHFGLFHLLSLTWQLAGINAQPIMRAPLAATSLAEFWSTRWNTAFNTLAHDLAFRPVARRLGVVGATVSVFLISGLIHEAVISLPARGGFGLPTAYFGLQALGVLTERSAWGRRLGLGYGFRGWLFVIGCVAAPVFWLFHPPFVFNVILPMLHAIGPH